ncbi:MAG: 50S ribosomal protein L35 [Chloroflexi bacterium]|nr:50S ribosomal protein L35 [Chloroflexota bacterium]
MPKIRTHKSAQRRFHVTGTGKIMHSKVGKSHLRSRKSPRVKRQYAVKVGLHPTNRRRIKQLLPYA